MPNRFLTTARVAGLLYIVVIVCAGFAQIVRLSVIEDGDATATADNIRDAEFLFRVGFSSDIVAFSADVALALVLYLLLRPVSEGIALLAAFFRLAQASTLGINLAFQFLAILLIEGGEYLSSFSPDQVDSLVYLFLEAHSYGYLLGLVFFAMSNLFLGYLVFKSGYLPAVFGLALMIFVTTGYLLDSFTQFLGSDEETLSLIFVAPAALIEITFALWLVVRGNTVRLPDAASTST